MGIMKKRHDGEIYPKYRAFMTGEKSKRSPYDYRPTVDETKLQTPVLGAD
jgi:hypothetical protein